MSDVVKWGLLIAGALAMIALIVALPFTGFIDLSEFTHALTSVVNIASGAFAFGRGLINNFLTPFGRTAFTGLLYWLFGKWAIMVTIKITAWVYHFIFK